MAQRALPWTPLLARLVAPLSAEERATLAQVSPEDLAAELRALLAPAPTDEDWRRWFDRLSAKKRRELADKARAAGFEAPESFEAARGVVWGEHIAAQFTPEELADLASGADMAPGRGMTLEEFERELAAGRAEGS